MKLTIDNLSDNLKKRIEAICCTLNVCANEIVEPHTSSRITEARRAVILMLSHESSYTQSEIGEIMGHRKRHTIIQSLKEINNLALSDHEFYSKLQSLFLTRWLYAQTQKKIIRLR
jgi:chromosomal replication initiation ATPase DnaA